MSMIKCPECKSKISSKAKICPHCGIEFSYKQIVMNEKSSKPPAKAFLIILAIVLVIGALGDIGGSSGTGEIKTSEPEQAKVVEEKVLTPVEKFFKENKFLGKVSNVTQIENWAQGERYKVRANWNQYLVYMKDDEVNTVYLTNITRTEIYRKDKTSLEEAEKKLTRQLNIEKQFSSFDGSHKALRNYIEDSLADPRSFKHRNTTYSDEGDHLIVEMEFSGKNAFNAQVINIVRAKVDIEGENMTILSIK